MDYTFYDEQTGDITFTLSSNFSPDPSNGDYIEGNFDPNLYRVINGVAVKKPSSEIEQVELEAAWFEFRKLRDGKLAESDWTQVPDAPVDRLAWATYRQALRDLPANTTDPRNPVWPALPA
jgi:hypothetical protein